MVLDGIRIIDFSQYIPGPYGSQRLTNMGAEVIRIEPIAGDPSRGFDRDLNKAGLIYQANNHGKKSMAINLKHEEGKKIIYSLIKDSDVLIEGFRPGVMERLELDFERIQKLKKDMIYLSLSGYGQKGPMSQLGSHDINYMSLSGALAQMKGEDDKPIVPSLTFADFLGGVITSEQILAALLQRERTGKGTYIDLALTDIMHSFMNTHLHIDKNTGAKHGVPALTGRILSYNIYETKDNRYVSLAALEPKFWRNLCNAIERPEWKEAQYTLAEEGNHYYQELKKLFKQKSLKEWTEFGLKVDCCLTPILEVDELEQHPYFAAKERLLIPETSPTLGEHTTDILEHILRKTKDEIFMLRNDGVIYP